MGLGEESQVLAVVSPAEQLGEHAKTHIHPSPLYQRPVNPLLCAEEGEHEEATEPVDLRHLVVAVLDPETV